MLDKNEVCFFRVEGIQDLVRGKIENNDEDGFYLLSGVKLVNSEGIKRGSINSKDGMVCLNKSKILYFYNPDLPEP